MIDGMIKLLRAEEASDIKHRDLCQNSIDKNTNDIADSNHLIEKTIASIDEMTAKVKELEEQVKQLDRDMSQTKTDMEERLKMRNEERKVFEYSIKDDVEAVKVVNQVIVTLEAFYKKNRVCAELVQEEPPAGPEYTVDQDKAPELGYEGGDYGGRKEETGGIVTILQVIATDIENELKVAREEDAKAQAEYEEERKALEELLHAQEANKIATEKEIAETKVSISSAKAQAEYEEERKALE